MITHFLNPKKNRNFKYPNYCLLKHFRKSFFHNHHSALLYHITQLCGDMGSLKSNMLPTRHMKPDRREFLLYCSWCASVQCNTLGGKHYLPSFRHMRSQTPGLVSLWLTKERHGMPLPLWKHRKLAWLLSTDFGFSLLVEQNAERFFLFVLCVLKWSFTTVMFSE